MIKVDVYNAKGEKVRQVDLPETIFAVPVKEAVVHQVVVAIQANQRRPWAHTKDRSEVAGGGRKPWRQKGTGRARHGSIRSPLWIGGGVTFGPRKDVNYKKKLNKKVKRLALFMVLSDRVASQALKVVDNFSLAEIKTKKFLEILKNLSLENKRVLVVVGQDEEDKEKIYKSARNLPGVKPIALNNLNILDILASEFLLMTEGAVKQLVDLYQPKQSK